MDVFYSFINIHPSKYCWFIMAHTLFNIVKSRIPTRSTHCSRTGSDNITPIFFVTVDIMERWHLSHTRALPLALIDQTTSSLSTFNGFPKNCYYIVPGFFSIFPHLPHTNDEKKGVPTSERILIFFSQAIPHKSQCFKINNPHIKKTVSGEKRLSFLFSFQKQNTPNLSTAFSLANTEWFFNQSRNPTSQHKIFFEYFSL